MKNITVFASGNGSNLQEIIDCTLNQTLQAKVSLVISDKPNCNALNRARKHNIHTMDYNTDAWRCNSLFKSCDLIVLAGFMKIIPESILNKFQVPIINLHPALPGEYDGSNAIERAFNDYKNDKCKRTGVMVHHVIPQIDAGEVIEKRIVNIYPEDTLDTLTERMHVNERMVLIKAIKKMLGVKMGKVKDVYDIGRNMLSIVYSDRISAFDNVLSCTVPNKGQSLLKTTEWWFKNTKHIMDNHYLDTIRYGKNHALLVKKCELIPVEVIVRGYITGSLWRNYDKGMRNYCGVEFQHGLIKNQKIDICVTPTTKDDEGDEAITAAQIIERGYCTSDEWLYISRKAIELFKYGQMMSREKGLLLVDTKFEFGRDIDGNIILIDEMFTADSSRYWLSSSYDQKFNEGAAPDSYDKDVIRNYLLQHGKDATIPTDLITRTSNVYAKMTYQLTGNKCTDTVNNTTMNEQIENYIENNFDKIVIMAGSTSDRPHVEKLCSYIPDSVCVRTHYASAHKNAPHVLEILKSYEGQRVVIICSVGMSNGLSAVVAGHSKFPVIANPVFKDKVDMMVNIQSTLQLPSKVPALTVLSPANAVLAALRILNL